MKEGAVRKKMVMKVQKCKTYIMKKNCIKGIVYTLYIQIFVL